MTSSVVFAVWPLIISLVYMGFAVLIVYCLILFIKLARRGIKLMDLHINEKEQQLNRFD